MKKLGVALGGGGLKGLAHIGVLQILHENNIPVSFISGTSAGSIIAALFAVGMSPYAMEKLVLGLKAGDYVDYDLAGFFKYIFSLYIPGYKVPLKGFIKGKRIERMIYKLTGGKKLNDVLVPIAIIACDIDTGREIIFTNQEIEGLDKNTIIVRDAYLSEAVRASISIPVTFVPARFKDMQLVDGGIKEIIPAEAVSKMGAEYVLSVNLGWTVYNRQVKNLDEIVKRTLSILIYETSGDTLDYYSDLILSPPVPEVNLKAIEKAYEIIRIGRKSMKKSLDDLKKGLNS
ncbi:patatin-like phospholipase family protein [Thermosyntropha sp.]|uniref:patatin-like phospholipase family protein n=1 Tax=Thermosyntropha sp. TaxID=2740820 RepID=UPI0025E09B84|nr:patatin-like phospholipase family protein [Thermosyntropha sp.]MBO8159796.1 patatin-like phospholipase family protein [Thermosyntropha sp.]